jgi:hypothetical protein
LFQLSDNINVQPKRGPVAQLGARFHGMEEVVGSIPTRSTIFTRLESIASRAFARILQKTRTNRPDVVPKVVAYHAADPFAKRIHPTKTLHLSVSCRLCWCLSRMALPVPQSVKRMTYAKRPSLARAVLFAGKNKTMPADWKGCGAPVPAQTSHCPGRE